MALVLGTTVRFGGVASPNGLQGSLPTPPLYGQIIVATQLFDPTNPTQTGLQVGWNNGTTQNITQTPGVVTEIEEAGADPADTELAGAFLQLLGRIVQLGSFGGQQLPNSGQRSRGVVLSVYRLTPGPSPSIGTGVIVALVRTAGPPSFARPEEPVFYEAPIPFLNVLKSA